MKKPDVTRYDLDKVYFMQEYKKAVSYGNQNINIQGVKAQLQELEQAKKVYFDKVANVVNPERDTEQAKYQKYEKWAINEKKIKFFEIILILVLILRLALFKYLPVAFRTSLIFTLTDIAFCFVTVFIGPISFIVAKIFKLGHAFRYNQYIMSIRNILENLGSDFTRTSLGYYDAIDNLYLGSLDPAHREMILLRRQQEMHNQDMLRLEKERQKAEKQRLNEQQRTRQATEELLAIERERERRYRGW